MISRKAGKEELVPFDNRDWLHWLLCKEFPVYRDAPSYEVAPRMRRVADEILERLDEGEE